MTERQKQVADMATVIAAGIMTRMREIDHESSHPGLDDVEIDWIAQVSIRVANNIIETIEAGP